MLGYETARKASCVNKSVGACCCRGGGGGRRGHSCLLSWRLCDVASELVVLCNPNTKRRRDAFWLLRIRSMKAEYSLGNLTTEAARQFQHGIRPEYALHSLSRSVRECMLTVSQPTEAKTFNRCTLNYATIPPTSSMIQYVRLPLPPKPYIAVVIAISSSSSRKLEYRT